MFVIPCGEEESGRTNLTAPDNCSVIDPQCQEGEIEPGRWRGNCYRIYRSVLCEYFYSIFLFPLLPNKVEEFQKQYHQEVRCTIEQYYYFSSSCLCIQRMKSVQSELSTEIMFANTWVLEEKQQHPKRIPNTYAHYKQLAVAVKMFHQRESSMSVRV